MNYVFSIQPVSVVHRIADLFTVHRKTHSLFAIIYFLRSSFWHAYKKQEDGDRDEKLNMKNEG
jgi:hypothetical protein